MTFATSLPPTSTSLPSLAQPGQNAGAGPRSEGGCGDEQQKRVVNMRCYHGDRGRRLSEHLARGQRMRSERGGARRTTFPRSLMGSHCFSAVSSLDHSSLGLLGRLCVRGAGRADPSQGNDLRRAFRRLRKGRPGRVAGHPQRGAPVTKRALSSCPAAECRSQRMKRGFCRSPRDGPERANSYCLAARLPWPS